MRIFFVSMGCAKNTADSEHLTAQLEALGHEIIDTPNEADTAIINTCGFIQDAVKENIDAILDLEKLKEDGLIKRIIVAGCLVNRYEQELRAELPSVDLFARSEEWEKVITFLGGKFNANCQTVASPINHQFWTRYLKISEGCNTLCSYCAIPLIRGRLRSIPVKQLAAEARMLCSAGAKELCLVGQDLTVYGQDIGSTLQELVHTLNSELPSGTWLRLLYLHPNRVDEALIDFLMTQEKVLHYLDIPIQHADPEILALMNRPCPEGHMRRIFSYIRGQDPLFTLRTTIMTGFPGEKDSHFERVMDFVSDVEFDRLGVFVYSPEEGTPAAKLKGRVSRKTAEARCTRLTNLQAEIAHERSSLFIGSELDVLIEEIDSENGEVWGRSYRDAPEIDGMVCVEGADSVKLGDIVRAKINDCNENDLFGEAVTC
ncbi:MAG: 30S ribosomal protein S12 methylthiotransferase RimO [Synergistaceae bacterium]|nr:30S ribosomal protein S12 methylthiotransferase RimO [Synergistaceae bacterium]